ncbi:M20 family metallopeptidase [Bacillus sp. FJAT-47783]|uniref:M20 family metallopeptidase n=1 Tax=Bacillus sp. FJAT-47783 TaxID=2922712 RepID=UPI001FACE79E|nr:M20 family metallopeptidase [Bacillus sp. FJAT-47783]
MEQLVEKIDRKLNDKFNEMVELRRYFHQYPELSFEEKNTPIKIAKYLTTLGIEVKTGVGGSGVVGIIRGGKPGKTVALRADFDALAIQDEKDVPYKSKVPGVMHACGHDAHTATLLGVASVLHDMKDDLVGNVVLIHQFAEELAPGGAKPMIEDGCLDGVDAIFGTHIWSTMPVGEIGYRSGPTMAAADRFEIKIQGKGGHGASPHETVDSVALGTALVQQLQQIVSRRIDPLEPAVITVAYFHAGSAFNVIADSATIGGTVRTFDPDVQNFIINEMERITKSICDGGGASYEFDYSKGYPAVVNHDAETSLLVKSAAKIVGKHNVKKMKPMMGGEDFAYYLQKVPGTFFFTGAGNSEIGAEYPHHHPKFNIDEKSMLIAGKVLLTATLDYLNKK